MFTKPATPSGRKTRQAAYKRNAKALPFDKLNVLNTFERAEHDYDSYIEGCAWYGLAHDIAQEHAHTYNTTVEQACGVLAALSPQTGWALNVRLAGEFWERYLQRRTDLFVGHTTDVIVKCQRIGRGESPGYVLGGRKVRSFYSNLLYPYQPGHVTIDRHAIAVLLAASNPQSRAAEGSGNYQRAAAAYRAVARDVGLLPQQLQAVCWVQWRKETGSHVYSMIEEF